MSCFCIILIVNSTNMRTYIEVAIIGRIEKGWRPNMKETTILGVPLFNGFVSPHGAISTKKLEKLTSICCNK